MIKDLKLRNYCFNRYKIATLPSLHSQLGYSDKCNGEVGILLTDTRTETVMSTGLFVNIEITVGQKYNLKVT